MLSWVRRLSRLDLDVFRLGTAISNLLTCFYYFIILLFKRLIRILPLVIEKKMNVKNFPDIFWVRSCDPGGDMVWRPSGKDPLPGICGTTLRLSSRNLLHTPSGSREEGRGGPIRRRWREHDGMGGTAESGSRRDRRAGPITNDYCYIQRLSHFSPHTRGHRSGAL